jgi:hypothetical protein
MPSITGDKRSFPIDQVESKEAGVEAARQLIEVDEDCRGRKWLVTYADSYDEPRFRIELQVLEGSPARGYIVASPDSITAFDMCDRIIKRFERI